MTRYSAQSPPRDERECCISDTLIDMVGVFGLWFGGLVVWSLVRWFGPQREPAFMGGTMIIEEKVLNEAFKVVGKNQKKVVNTQRPKTKWLGGVDAHHIFFEGLYCHNGRIYVEICWLRSVEIT